MPEVSERPLLRVLNPAELAAAEQAQAARQAPRATQPSDEARDGLAHHVRQQWEMMRRHRDSERGWNNRLLHAMQVFNGEYSAEQKQAIKKFGGSEVFARLIAVKCRGATAMLRDVYLGPERPWRVDPTPQPTLPDAVGAAVKELLKGEIMGLAQQGLPMPPEEAIRDRYTGLMSAAEEAAKRQAREQAKGATSKLDDILTEGGFYRALAEFLVDLPLFPYAVLKGPVVRIVPRVRWVNRKAVIENLPRMEWQRISPFDVWWTPGVADIIDATVIERSRLTRTDINVLIGLPGYDDAALRQVLIDYESGHNEAIDTTDNERSLQESRESPVLNESGLIDCLEFHGPVRARWLIEKGFSRRSVGGDPDRDVFVQAWVIGRHVIKVQIAPSPTKRHPYFVSSFEKVPGTVVGNALPDILHDIQDVCNATLRSLVNNLSISSGPQVVINEDRLGDTDDNSNLYPWKRWFVTDSENGNTAEKPVDFFQPNSNAQELLGVYEKFTMIADDLSAVPRYITGSDRMGGGGRTASGLAMLMGNASKILQTVAANIDRDVMEPLLSMLYDMVMLTDQTGLLRGDESVNVRGVSVAVQRETERQRQIELLQATMNPLDSQIMGVRGRGALLRAVVATTGLEGEEVIPDDATLKKMQEAAMAPPPGPPGAPAPPGPPGASAPPGSPAAAAAQGQGAQPPAPTAIQGPRTNLQQDRPRQPAIGAPQ